MENYAEFVEKYSKIDNFIELNTEILEKLDDKNLMFFQFADGGAMGESGEIYLLMKDKTLYHTNHLFGYITLNQLIEKFKSVSNCCFVFLSSFVAHKSENFESFKLGFGNSLFVKNEIVDSFKSKCAEHEIELKNEVKLFKNWLKIALEIL